MTTASGSDLGPPGGIALTPIGHRVWGESPSIPTKSRGMGPELDVQIAVLCIRPTPFLCYNSEPAEKISDAGCKLGF